MPRPGVRRWRGCELIEVVVAQSRDVAKVHVKFGPALDFLCALAALRENFPNALALPATDSQNGNTSQRVHKVGKDSHG